MSRPILVDPRGGPVRVVGEILEPGFAPLKIDVWRHVRHPPPDLIHAYSVKSLVDQEPGSYLAGLPAALIGKIVSWVWVCDHLSGALRRFRVRIDVSQDGESCPGYPAEYKGPLPGEHPLAQLKISEEVRSRSEKP